ncbi:MAG: outer membrane beta-barrel protein [Pseudomonadota bacterium]
MMKAFLTCASLTLLAGSITSAYAQSSDSWTGPYAGVYVGTMLDADNSDADSFLFDTNLDGNFGDTVFTAAGANAFSPGSCSGSANGPTPGAGCGSDDTGTSAGLRAGYDWQMGTWLIGVLGEYERGDMSDTVTSFSTTPASYTMKRELDDAWAFRVRTGFIFGAGDSSLLYATGGVIQAGVENSFTTSNTVNTFTANGDDDVDGTQWGVGYDYRFNDTVTIGVEYLASRLEDDGYRVRAAGPAPATNPFIRTNAAGTDFRRSDRYVEPESVHVTAGWRF